MFLSRHQNAGQNQNIKTDNRTYENVAQVKYLRMAVTNQSFIHEEIKSRLNSNNCCYHSFQNLLSSRMLCKNAKIKIYKTIIFPVVLYACETRSLTLRKKHRLRVFDNMVLRGIFVPKGNKIIGYRKLHNEQLQDLYSSSYIIKMSR
jgi:hypothetical protein